MTAMTLRQFSASTSRAASDTANFIAEQAQKLKNQWQASYTLGQEAKGTLSELYRVYFDCSQSNWDGYGAMPVSRDTYELACQFVEALPPGMPAPSVGAEPDGHMTLEWYKSPHQTISISVSPEHELHWAMLFGTSRTYGTEPFYEEVPIELIRRIISI